MINLFPGREMEADDDGVSDTGGDDDDDDELMMMCKRKFCFMKKLKQHIQAPNNEVGLTTYYPEPHD